MAEAGRGAGVNFSVTVATVARRILWVGPGLTDELNVDAEDIVGRSILDLVHRSSQSTLVPLLAGTSMDARVLTGANIRMARRTGSFAEFDVRSVRYVDRQGERVAFIRMTCSSDGVTAGKLEAGADGGSQASIGRWTDDVLSSDRFDVVLHGGDDLTGLPLRSGLLARLDAAAFDDSSVVVVVDIDDFGQLNARVGSVAGDEILAELGARLAACVRGGDFAARLSGDGFGVVGIVEDAAEARSIAQRIERVLAEPFEVDGTLLSVAMSIGAAWGPNSGRARLLFDRAELALGVARTNGGRRLCFQEPNDDVAGWQDLATFAADLRRALASGQIFVAYQPIVELGSGRLEKIEALARWRHPVRGDIAPDVFIPLAERSGTIDELGEWIFDRSCADIARLAGRGIVAEISINVSATQLHDPSIADRVTLVLERHRIDPGRVWIEVTESVLLDDDALGPLHRLHDLGMHLVIDDFGTGYATFQYLTRLPVDAVKIDTAFVKGLGVDASDTAIVRSVINLGRELGLQVIAEGVETESQRSQLVALECRLAQGWLFNRGLAFDDLVAAYGGSAGEVAPPMSADDAQVEAQRVAALRACKILDTTADAAFDSIVLLASQLLGTPMALVSLVDSNRQWFKARVGVDVTETPRDVAFCNHAIAHPRTPFLVHDALLDDRFVDNPLVVAGPAIRAYAGIPIRSREGLPMGTLCVLDIVPRTFTDEQVQQLTMLAEQTGAILDLRRRAAELNDLLHMSGHRESTQNADHVDVTQSARDGATAVGEAVVELTRISERSDDTPGQPANVLRFGPLELRLNTRTVVLDGHDLDITAKEFDLLAFLATNAGRAFTRAELLHEIWHSAPDRQNSARVTEHIYRLRSKIEVNASHPRLLQTVRGTGYRFEPNVGESDADARTIEMDPRAGEFTHDDETNIVAADPGMLDMMMTTDLGDIVGHDILDVIAPSSHPAAQARMEMRASGHTPGPQVIALLTTTGAEVVTMLRSADGDLDELPVVNVSVREITDPPHLMRQIVNGVVNEVSDAVIVTDPDLHVLSWNPAAQRLYGWSEREVLGHTLQNVVRALEPLDLAFVRAEIETSGRWSSDARHITRKGVIIDVQTTLNVITDDHGAVTAIVAVNRPERERAPIEAVLGHATAKWSDVQRAVNRNEFVVYYEPVVSLGDRSVVGANVRVRWLRPDGGTWDLVDFISDVERADALGDLARYVYPTAFLQFERWHRAGRAIELFVDVSANQLADQNFTDVLAPVIVRLRVAGSSLCLKVRENELKSASDATHAALQSLAAAGARIIVSGLGSGWVSAVTLDGLGVAAVAFDAALIGTENAAPAGVARARRVVALGAELTIPVWVEGVVDEHQHATAKRIGCTAGNGPLYGAPTLGDHLDQHA